MYEHHLTMYSIIYYSFQSHVLTYYKMLSLFVNICYLVAILAVHGVGHSCHL